MSFNKPGKRVSQKNPFRLLQDIQSYFQYYCHNIPGISDNIWRVKLTESRLSPEIVNILQQLLGTFRPQLAYLIRKLYSFSEETPKTETEVAEEWGCTRQNISKLKRKAFRQFVHPPYRDIIEDLIGVMNDSSNSDLLTEIRNKLSILDAPISDYADSLKQEFMDELKVSKIRDLLRLFFYYPFLRNLSAEARKNIENFLTQIGWGKE